MACDTKFKRVYAASQRIIPVVVVVCKDSIHPQEQFAPHIGKLWYDTDHRVTHTNIHSCTRSLNESLEIIAKNTQTDRGVLGRRAWNQDPLKFLYQVFSIDFKEEVVTVLNSQKMSCHADIAQTFKQAHQIYWQSQTNKSLYFWSSGNGCVSNIVHRHGEFGAEDQL